MNRLFGSIIKIGSEFLYRFFSRMQSGIIIRKSNSYKSKPSRRPESDVEDHRCPDPETSFRAALRTTGPDRSGGVYEVGGLLYSVGVHNTHKVAVQHGSGDRYHTPRRAIIRGKQDDMATLDGIEAVDVAFSAEKVLTRGSPLALSDYLT